MPMVILDALGSLFWSSAATLDRVSDRIYLPPVSTVKGIRYAKTCTMTLSY